MQKLKLIKTIVTMLLLTVGQFLGYPRHLSSPVKESVMVIGGSVAHGWNDVEGEGYIRRAIQSYQSMINLPIDYIDRTIPGLTSTQLVTQYQTQFVSWLSEEHPAVVIFSWGILDDAYQKTPISQFAANLQLAIDDALKVNAIVLVVSPPITKATYTEYPLLEEQYNHEEQKIVQTMQNKNVHYVDLLDQMKNYLSAHHQTYAPYESNGWHPNSKGHILAGQLLVDDLERLFGKKMFSNNIQ